MLGKLAFPTALCFSAQQTVVGKVPLCLLFPVGTRSLWAGLYLFHPGIPRAERDSVNIRRKNIVEGPRCKRTRWASCPHGAGQGETERRGSLLGLGRKGKMSFHQGGEVYVHGCVE